jgi:HK97 gp10 family phage protein
MDELIATLEEMGPKTRVKVEHAVNAACIDGLVVQRDLSPVRTGFLKSRNQVVALGWSGDVVMYQLMNDAYYAIYLVYGTYKMAAQDFMTPAIAVARKSLVRRIASIKIID